jgi:hypothetical protein
MKIRPVGAEFFHADGRTDIQTCGRTNITKLLVAFSNCSKAPKNASYKNCTDTVLHQYHEYQKRILHVIHSYDVLNF